MAEVAKASSEIEKLATPDSSSKLAVEVKRRPITEMLYVRTPEFITSLVLLLILLFFLLAYDGVFVGKLIKLLPTLSDKERAVSIAQEIESQVSRYLFTVTIINCCLSPRGGHDCWLARPSQPGDVGRISRNFKFGALRRRAHRHYLHDDRRYFKLR